MNKDKMLIDGVMKALEEKPDRFSAMWYNKKVIDSSVRSLSGDINIMITTGEIFRPIKPVMSENEKKKMIDLLKPIVDRDTAILYEQNQSEIEKILRNI